MGYLACIAGKEIWDNITYVMYLKQNMRHSSNPRWISILNNWRLVIFNRDDVKYVNDQCSTDQPLPDTVPYCPFITASNVARVNMNHSATYQYALRNNLDLFQIPAFHQNMPIPESFWTLRDDTTQRIPMLLELVISMPLSCNSNNPNLKLSNGTLVHLVEIRWPNNIQFHVETTQDGVNIKRASILPELLFVKRMDSDITLPGLPGSIIALPPLKKQVAFKLENRRKFIKQITQMPVVPAFAITTDKSQGLTFEASVIGPQYVNLRPI